MAKITKTEASRVQSRADKSANPELKELAQNLQSAADRRATEAK
jgi:hypothetical protein